MLTEEVYMTRVDRVVADVQNLSTTTRSLKRTHTVPVRNRKMIEPKERKRLGASTRELGTLRSGLCPRCSSGHNMEVTMTRKMLPFDYVVGFPRKAEAQYRSGLLQVTTSRTKSVTEGGAAVPGVPNLPGTQSETVVKSMGSQWLASRTLSQTCKQLSHAEQEVQIFLGGVRNLREFRYDSGRKVECKKRCREEYKGTEPRRRKV